MHTGYDFSAPSLCDLDQVFYLPVSNRLTTPAGVFIYASTAYLDCVGLPADSDCGILFLGRRGSRQWRLPTKYQGEEGTDTSIEGNSLLKARDASRIFVVFTLCTGAFQAVL
uniref:hypothetical protein n=1 Tax=Ochrobactrum sp. LM19 TaxID=1449781 RepID=UPI0015E82A37|nr:hypothetical protein [Ochrobactrum sp. LM19]